MSNGDGMMNNAVRFARKKTTGGLSNARIPCSRNSRNERNILAVTHVTNGGKNMSECCQ
jgi:hypothetical protein